MQISFNPKEIDLPEATMVMGLLMGGFVKGCRDQGDTCTEVQAGLSELARQVWQLLEAAEKDS